MSGEETAPCKPCRSCEPCRGAALRRLGGRRGRKKRWSSSSFLLSSLELIDTQVYEPYIRAVQTEMGTAKMGVSRRVSVAG